jgi:hypothetical protein
MGLPSHRLASALQLSPAPVPWSAASKQENEVSLHGLAFFHVSCAPAVHSTPVGYSLASLWPLGTKRLPAKL